MLRCVAVQNRNYFEIQFMFGMKLFLKFHNQLIYHLKKIKALKIIFTYLGTTKNSRNEN